MPTLVKFCAAFVFVLSLMLLLGWVLRKAGFQGMAAATGARRRLKLVESLPLDHRRRLVLVRRDDTEHLLVLNAEGETVVETGIPAPAEKVVELPVGERKNAQA